MAKPTKTPHDAIFKSVFEKPEHAAAELQHILAPELTAAVRWSSLSLEPGSFVDPKLADTHSDLLFSAVAESSGEPLLVYIVFEHQSTSDPRMPLRLLGYMVNIWKRHAKTHGDGFLPLIIPALLAQVPGGWKSPTRFSELFTRQAQEAGHTVLPDFAFAVDDLAQVTDDDLKRRSLGDQAKLTLWLMRDIRDRAALFAHLVGWAEALERLARSPYGQEELGVLLRYMAVVSGGLQLDHFRDILDGRAPALESFAMTLEEMFDAKAREVGRARFHAEGHAEGQAQRAASSIFTVLEARGLPISDAGRQRIEACTDLEQLERWLVLAATAASADALFQA